MVACALFPICSQIGNAFKLSSLIDRYPPEMAETIRKIKSLINADIYDALTNPRASAYFLQTCSQVAWDLRVGDRTSVVSFDACQDWVVKSSLETPFKEAINLLQDNLDGSRYTASNEHGGVGRVLFSLPARVEFANRLRAIIKDYNLTHISVPEKYLLSFPLEYAPKTLFSVDNRRVFVLARKCKTYLSGSFTERALRNMSHEIFCQLSRQMAVLFKYSGLIDMHNGNFYIDRDRLVIFDTEPLNLCLVDTLSLTPSQKAIRINLFNLRRLARTPQQLRVLNDVTREETPRSFVEIKPLVIVAITAIFLMALFYSRSSVASNDLRV